MWPSEFFLVVLCEELVVVYQQNHYPNSSIATQVWGLIPQVCYCGGLYPTCGEYLICSYHKTFDWRSIFECIWTSISTLLWFSMFLLTLWIQEYVLHVLSTEELLMNLDPVSIDPISSSLAERTWSIYFYIHSLDSGSIDPISSSSAERTYLRNQSCLYPTSWLRTQQISFFISTQIYVSTQDFVITTKKVLTASGI